MKTTLVRNNVLALSGLLAIGALSLPSAQASWVLMDYTGLDGSNASVSFKVQHGDDAGNYTTKAGAMSWTQSSQFKDQDLGSSFNAYCIELAQGTPDNAQWYVTSSPADVLGATQAASIAKLWAHYDAGNLDGASATAFQLAVWNILYDTDYTLSSGNLYVTSADSGVVNKANDMLSWLEQYGSGATQATLTALTSWWYQDQITSIDGKGNPPAVPEPATLGIGAVALAGLALKKRARR